MAYQLEQSKQRNTANLHQPRYTETQSNDPCLRRRDIVDAVNCIIQQARARRDDKRAEYDLQAQQDMAAWAYGVLLFSLAGMTISILGVVVAASGIIYVRRSLSFNREAIDVTRDIGEAQARAYITIPQVVVYVDDALPLVVIAPFCKNSGQSPATEVIVSLQIDVWHGYGIRIPPLPGVFETIHLGNIGVGETAAASVGFGSLMLPREAQNDEYKKVTRVAVEAVAFGLDVFKREITTYFNGDKAWNETDDRRKHSSLEVLGSRQTEFTEKRIAEHRARLPKDRQGASA